MKKEITWLGNKVVNPDPPTATAQTTGQGTGTSTARRNSSATTDQSSYVQGPPSVDNKYYITGYLARNIGKNVKAEFVVGTNQYVDKTGILREVGVNYFVLEDYISHALIMCDLYSVKFVTIL